MRMKITTTKKYIIVKKADLILNKDMELDITREKERLKIGTPQCEREF